LLPAGRIAGLVGFQPLQERRSKRTIESNAGIGHLDVLLELLSEIEANRVEVLTARNRTIQELHRSGVRIADLVSITGLTRARVNQILAGTR